jgi:hypothetical protein
MLHKAALESPLHNVHNTSRIKHAQEFNMGRLNYFLFAVAIVLQSHSFPAALAQRIQSEDDLFGSEHQKLLERRKDEIERRKPALHYQPEVINTAFCKEALRAWIKRGCRSDTGPSCMDEWNFLKTQCGAD